MQLWEKGGAPDLEGMLLHYRRDSLWIFRRRGSLFPHAFFIALPSALISVGLKLAYLYLGDEYFAMRLLNESGGTAAWSGFNFLVGFVIVFRTSQAYSRFWDAMSDTEKMMAEWFDAASSIAAFTQASNQSVAVEVFLHTAMRLFSMLSASALQDLSQVKLHDTWGLPVLDPSVVDKATIITLEAAKETRVEIMYQWIQQLVTVNISTGVVNVPPPILARAFAELSNGMAKFQDARKHAKIPFPFPYAQTTTWILIFHWALTPLIMVLWSDWAIGAFIFTFIQVFLMWALNFMAAGFEQPFGGDINDLDPDYMQKRMNQQLICLMEPSSRKTPSIDPRDFYDVHTLKKTANMTQAALLREGWELKSLVDEDDKERRRRARRCCCCCPCRCGKNSNVAPKMQKVAVSMRYCHKRYAEVDGERTAVLTVAIFEDELVLALPLAKDAVPKEGHIFSLMNVKGKSCQLRMKRVPIVERHGLVKAPPKDWGGVHLDFPKDYSFRQEDLVALYHANAGKGGIQRSRIAPSSGARKSAWEAAAAEETGTVALQLASADEQDKAPVEKVEKLEKKRSDRRPSLGTAEEGASKTTADLKPPAPGTGGAGALIRSEDSSLSVLPRALEASPTSTPRVISKTGAGRQASPGPAETPAASDALEASQISGTPPNPSLAATGNSANGFVPPSRNGSAVNVEEADSTGRLTRNPSAVSASANPGSPEREAPRRSNSQVGIAGVPPSSSVSAGPQAVAASAAAVVVPGSNLGSTMGPQRSWSLDAADLGPVQVPVEAMGALGTQAAPTAALWRSGACTELEVSASIAVSTPNWGARQGDGVAESGGHGGAGVAAVAGEAGLGVPAEASPKDSATGDGADLGGVPDFATVNGFAGTTSTIGIGPAIDPEVVGTRSQDDEATTDHGVDSLGSLVVEMQDKTVDASVVEAEPEKEQQGADEGGAGFAGGAVGGDAAEFASAYTIKVEPPRPMKPELDDTDFDRASSPGPLSKQESRGGDVVPWGGVMVEDSDNDSAGGEMVPWGGRALVHAVSTDSLSSPQHHPPLQSQLAAIMPPSRKASLDCIDEVNSTLPGMVPPSEPHTESMVAAPVAASGASGAVTPPEPAAAGDRPAVPGSAAVPAQHAEARGVAAAAAAAAKAAADAANAAAAALAAIEAATPQPAASEVAVVPAMETPPPAASAVVAAALTTSWEVAPAPATEPSFAADDPLELYNDP